MTAQWLGFLLSILEDLSSVPRSYILGSEDQLVL